MAEEKAEREISESDAVALGDRKWKLRFFGKKLSLEELPHRLPSDGEYDISKVLAGPMREMDWFDAYKLMGEAELLGIPHIQYEKWQKEYGNSLSSNIVVPKIIYTREHGDTGKRNLPLRIQQVVIGNPLDAEKIARRHVRKQPNFNTGLYGSIISTVDNDHWKAQREHLIPAFLPKLSLQRIFPISLNRARFCAERYRRMSENGTKEVDMNDFFLYETEAQLQLALFGEDQEFMESTNERFRYAMGGKENPAYVRTFCKDLSSHFSRDTNSCPVHPDNDVAKGCPFKGPLANRLSTLEADNYTLQGNALIFAFAGHDTTGHTLTWLLYELAKNPHYQRQLQQEVDEFFTFVGGRDPVYEDLERLPFMTRCIMETLRLWPAVPNGTFREIQFDEYICGPDGKDVLLPKGTYVQIVNWSRHRNPDLWGDDVDTFNPNREFRDGEIWGNKSFAAFNPSSPRFSPFTFPPRGCIGMNFAQLEARLIMAYLLKDFTFEVIPEYKVLSTEEEKLISINYGTAGPRDIRQPRLVKHAKGGFNLSTRAPGGMLFTAVPRTQAAKL